MQLLYRRPLATVCVCFLCALYSALYLSVEQKTIAMLVLLPIVVLGFLGFLFSKKHRFLMFVVWLCIAALLLGVFYLYARLDRPQQDALAYTGPRAVAAQVLSEERRDERGTHYTVELTEIDGESVAIRSYMICPFAADLYPGDFLYAHADLMDPTSLTYGVVATDLIKNERVLLTTVIHEGTDGVGYHRGANDGTATLLLGRNGIELVSNRWRESLGNFLDEIFGEASALVRGFLIGDTSKMSTEQLRDFQRSGVSHLLAVSGLHISVLLGAVEWLLRRLTVPKLTRIAIISAGGVLLLMLTGFSMSACRAVGMLFLVYLHFLLAEDSDSLTALLISVTVILLISPYAVSDVGLWMSFFATLALVTVFPKMDARLPKKIFSSKASNLLWSILRAMLVTLSMTLLANLFLLPILWRVFGEISLIAPIANIILSPLGAIFLCQIPIAMLLFGIPYLGACSVAILSWTAERMTDVASFFSKQPWAVQSFQYRFAGIIVMALTVVMVILLLIRLRHTWLILIPPALAIVAFSVCLGFTYHAEDASTVYIRNGEARVLSVVNDGRAVLVDLFCGGNGAYSDAWETARLRGATYVDAVILGSPDSAHLDILPRFLRQATVGEVWLPVARDAQEELLCDKIASRMLDEGLTVREYSLEKTWEILGEVELRIEGGSDGHTVSLCSIRTPSKSVLYADFSVAGALRQKRMVEYARESNVLLLSAAGDSFFEFVLMDSEIEAVFLDDSPANMPLRLWTGEIPCYIYREENRHRRFLLSEN